jgi:hypothetical protein
MCSRILFLSMFIFKFPLDYLVSHKCLKICVKTRHNSKYLDAKCEINLEENLDAVIKKSLDSDLMTIQ